jgi:hypothetical protein
MRIAFVAGLFVVIGLLTACSKKEATTEAAAPLPAGTGKAGAAPVPDAAMLDAELAELARRVQAKQFDAAVGSLMSIKDFPKSEKEEAQFQNQLRATVNGLNEKAGQGDQAARANYQMLSRMMTGR